jgi:hypothetical protein
VIGSGISSGLAELFACGLLDELCVHLRRPYVREASPGFGLEYLAVVFIKNPGYRNIEQITYLA